MQDLTNVQRQVYLRLKQHWLARGGQPNLSELAKALDMHYVSLKQHLDLIAAKGYLSFKSQGKGKAPIIKLYDFDKETSDKSVYGIPLVGDIAAGGLHEAIEQLEGYLSLPLNKQHFALRVKGDSMADLIQDKDIVILKKTQVYGGEICAIRYEDDVTLKYLDLYRDGSALLRPHNPLYDPIEVNQVDIVVEGVFQSLLRGAIIQDLLMVE